MTWSLPAGRLGGVAVRADDAEHPPGRTGQVSDDRLQARGLSPGPWLGELKQAMPASWQASRKW